MPTYNLLLIPGDGIGPEVMAEVKKLIGWMNAHGMGTFETDGVGAWSTAGDTIARPAHNSSRSVYRKKSAGVRQGCTQSAFMLLREPIGATLCSRDRTNLTTTRH